MRLLAISGSLRSGSHNTELLRAAGADLPEDVEFVLWSGLADIPAYDWDLDVAPPPRPVAELRAEIERSDAVLIATPEYNSSVPGALKNALDWASRPYPGNVLRRKRVAVVGASTGLFGALAAQAELRKVLEDHRRGRPRRRSVAPRRQHSVRGRTSPRSRARQRVRGDGRRPRRRAGRARSLTDRTTGGQSTWSTAFPPIRRSSNASWATAASRHEHSSSTCPSSRPSAMSRHRRERSPAPLPCASSSSKRFSV